MNIISDTKPEDMLEYMPNSMPDRMSSGLSLSQQATEGDSIMAALGSQSQIGTFEGREGRQATVFVMAASGAAAGFSW